MTVFCISVHYLNENGTKINDDLKAKGSFYNGHTVKDVNINYEDYRIIGFENHLGHLVSDSNNDIINYNNFYGTYIIGPLLVRNPYLCKDFIKNLIINKDKDFKFQKDNYELEEKAYNEKKEN